ncbi:30S ribosomal protein S17 [Candidatus Gottesmanbacteria bacterium RBG_16_52_11]|uniref:30S ribosomal protein S17 n=1 Tax=Candidatus Gottesmanbacteria bacterium RBG_16_52_11 TaxID=1798374 RepID=A0A1F5YXS6_9BACT|nr:MAG: 30S ribosomal protein S17 [Candidatus Gottesmanbacteria bacterium RBG_16_52_11]
MKNNQKKEGIIQKGLTGSVVSVRQKQTAIVEVMSIKRHPIYKKTVRRTRRYAAHNLLNDLKVGDKVLILPVRPMSRTKYYRIAEKITK